MGRARIRFFSWLVFSFCILIWGVFVFILPSRYVVPIMMYHNVEHSDTFSSDTVRPDNLRKQMDFLRRYGYKVITLDEYVRLKFQGTPRAKLPRRTVVITFDDGYLNNYTQAVPILREFQFPAMFFVSPGFVNTPGFLDYEDMRSMLDAGMGFGSHGMTQAYLPDLDRDTRWGELSDSRSELEKNLGIPILFFAYPVGGFSEDIKEEVAQTGYLAAVTTNRGGDRFNDDLLELNRIRFGDRDVNDLILKAKLSGYYNLFRTLKKPF